MGQRSHLLHAIGQHTGRRYLDVPDLQGQHPEYDRAFPRLGTIVGLEALLKSLQTGAALPVPAQRQRGAPRKALLSVVEMQSLRAEGKSFRAIGRLAGVSGEAVRLTLI